MASHANQAGYAITAQNFFSEFNQIDQAPCKQSIANVRKKLSWEAFRYLLEEARLPDEFRSRWHDRNVKIVDGTKISLPRTTDLINRFGVQSSPQGPGHYPKALMVTLIDAASSQPLAMEISDHWASERELMLKMMSYFTANDLVLLDRGLGGAAIYLEFLRRGTDFIHRVTTESVATPHYVRDFLNTGKISQITAVPATDPEDAQSSLLML